MKNLTNQLYQIEKESTVAAEQEVVKDVDAHILWLDNEITPAEATPTLTRWKATRSDNHHLVVRQILIENIPPNACSLEQLQNELDCESKKYVVKTAEMKHRRGKYSID